MKKRLAVIGKGTAGSQSIIHYLRYMEDCEIHWYFDQNTPTQSVGEGSPLTLPKNLFLNLNFNYEDLNKIDATLKVGIYKSGWGKTGKPFLHYFPAPTVGFHFNAKSLQNFIFESVKDKVVIHDKNVKHSDIDADYIMDCSGKPNSYEEFHQPEYIPVNSAYITQCHWEYPRFQHTLTIARPYGWVFGIPLQNRCSIGYLFNSNINNAEDIKKDVLQVFSDYNLIPSENTNHLEFNNYYRKENFSERVVYNGNSSFFLEPLEATSIAFMNQIQRDAFDMWNKNTTAENLNTQYKTYAREIENVIMLHYFAGSIYDTDFWSFAKERGNKAIKNAIKNDLRFLEFLSYSLKMKYSNLCEGPPEYGTWWAGAFCQNLIGLGLENILND
jgi:hypothetical protein